MLEAVDTALGHRLDGGGVRPREVDGLDGILFAPLLHAGWQHLESNTLPLLVFGFLILLAGVARWLAVTALVWLVGGVGVWLTGPSGSLHLGASVLAFGWLVYLLVRGVFSRRVAQVLLGLVLLVLYGGLLWGVLPNQPGCPGRATSSAPWAAALRPGGSAAGTGRAVPPGRPLGLLGPGLDDPAAARGSGSSPTPARGRRPSPGGCVRR